MDSSLVAVVPRHKTAIRRAGLSLPISCLLRDGLLDGSRTLFDYGCGRGQDLALLRDMDIACEGWDPVYRPEDRPKPADVVNLGYVINVVEDPAERAAALRGAWQLAQGVLVVAAQLDVAATSKDPIAYSDGVLTSRGTFQRYYTQSELRGYLEGTTGTDAVPAAPGVFYLFKEERARQEFLASRFRRQIALPRMRMPEALFEQSRDVLDPFVQSMTRLGRLPGPDEFPEYSLLVERFGTARRAQALVTRVTGSEPWSQIAAKRSEDLLVYLALSRFQRRPAYSALPPSTQRDAKAFFQTYQRACAEADALLFKVGRASEIDAACNRSMVGRLVDNALLLGRDALQEAEPILRIYEGCARALAGEVEEADVIKLHRFSGKVTYLVYRNFSSEDHPWLRFRIKVTLPTLTVALFDHSSDGVTSALDRKEGLLPSAA
jgi:DNA phosphorothioation-associated putative methyltransferase